MPQPRKPKAAEPAVFTLDDFRPIGFEEPDEREIEVRPGVVLHVTLTRLNRRQTKKIPWGTRVDIEKVYRAAWPYVLAWDLRARNPETGEAIPIPAPGEPAAVEFVKRYIGEDAEPWELLEVLDNDTGMLVMTWLVNPGAMKLSTSLGKPSSTPSKIGDTPPASADTAKT